MEHVSRQWTAGWVLLALSACGVDLTLPNAAQIACTSADDCPKPWICNSQTGFCAAPSGDLTPPGISDAVLSRSAVADGGTVRLSFNVSEPVTDRSRATIAWIASLNASGTFAFVNRTSAGVELEYTADQDRDPEGSASIRIEVWDEAGNPGEQVLAGALVTDFTDPAVFDSSVAITYVDPEAPIFPVTGARVGTTVRVSFIATEELAVDPEVTTPGLPTFTVEEQQGTLYVMSAVGVGSLPDGDHALSVMLEDAAGNRSEVALGVLRVRSTAPPAPDVQTPGVIVYLRAPWGTSSSSEPVFGLSGAAASVTPDVTVIARTAASPASLELGRVIADATGAFDLQLIASDVDRVYVTAVDAAGNASPAAAVRDVHWVGTLRNKVAGRVTENPHDLFPARPARTPTKVGDLAPFSDVDYEALFEVDGTSAGAEAFPEWEQRQAPTAALGRIFTAAAYDDARGVAVLFGGWDFDGIHDDTWQWDGAAWQQANPTFSPPARAFHQMTYDTARSRVVMYGGTTIANNLAGLWGFDGVTWRQLDAAVTPTPGPRVFHHLAYDAYRDEIVLYGGCDTLTCDPRLNDTWVWDGREWRDAEAGLPDGGRSRGTMGWDAEAGVVRLYGGCLQGDIDDCTEVSSDVYTWDGESWSLDASVGAPPAPRLSGTWVSDPDHERSLLLGGMCLVDNGSGGLRDEPCSDTWAWDTTLGGWTRAVENQSIEPAAGFTVAFFDRSLGLPVEALGTDASQDLFYTNTWALQGGDFELLLGGDTFTRPGRRGQRAVFDGSVFLVHGGASETDTDTCDLPDSIHCGNLLTWNGARWSEILYATEQGAYLPPHRSHHSMVYDANLGRSIIFGGRRYASATSPDPATTYNDLLAWDGSAWLDLCSTVQCLASRPSPRHGSGLAIDASDGTLLVFGGTTDALGEMAETWRFDGSQWSLICDRTADCSSPTARSHPGMVYDDARGVFVVFGGAGSGSAACPGDSGCNDTWEWTGSDWQLVCDPTAGCASPNPSEHAELVYDSVRKRVIAFLGDQVWTWDGQLWRNLSPPAGLPPIRTDAGVAYDSVRHKLVVFGGDVFDTPRNDLWEMDLSPDAKASLSGFFQLPPAYAVANVTDVELAVWLGATGYALDDAVGADGDLIGDAVDGGLTEVWSTATSGWVQGGTSSAGADVVPEASVTDSAAGAGADWVVGSDHTVHYRVMATAGAGNGPAPARVVVDFVEMTADFRLAAP